MRVYDAIRERRRSEGRQDLRDQLLWRLRVLTEARAPMDLRRAENQDAFREVLDAFVLDGLDVDFSPLHDCLISADDDGFVTFWGWLTDGEVDVAELSRQVMIGRRYANHALLRISPQFRGRRLAVRLLQRAIVLYDELGFEYVELRAALSVGRWYWARCGFSFANDHDRRNVQAWAQRLVDRFGGDLNVSQLNKPWQIAELGARGEYVSLEDLATEIPDQEEWFRVVAAENDLEFAEPMPFGRAVMITGPSWLGRLYLAGEDRVICDGFIQSRLSEAG